MKIKVEVFNGYKKLETVNRLLRILDNAYYVKYKGINYAVYHTLNNKAVINTK